MRVRVTVPHQGRTRGSIVDVDGRDRQEKGRLANGWLVAIDTPRPKRRKT